MHLTPDGLPSGIPGIEVEIDSAMQQAPHFSRHSIKAKKVQWYFGITVQR